ncbi:MAG TPA: flagellar hook-associated protein FlgK [Bryobacteraceae bacterium]|nr:flagellar hook-associated protein FlgK [Bryobacteraceae bacterium]
MSGLLSSLLNATGALRTFDRALATTQNNVANASTPGYARQRLTLLAQPFQPESGIMGGVSPGAVQTARDDWAEQSVRRNLNEFGRAAQFQAGMERLEPLFSTDGETGVPGAINELFQSFSALSVTPNDGTARREVLARAYELAGRIRETAASLSEAHASLDGELRNAADAVNRIAASIADANRSISGDFRTTTDPNLDANMHAALERLAEYTDYTALRQEDGRVTILLGGGRTQLVMGDESYPIGVDTGSGTARVLDGSGRDITDQIGSGSVRGLIDLKNGAFPEYEAGLDSLAAGLAGTINAVLAGGLDQAGDPGAPLFAVDGPGGAARNLRVVMSDPASLAAARGSAGGNGNALDLAALANSRAIDDLTFTAFYGNLGAKAGRALSDARGERENRELTLTQSRTLRDEASRVSLDEEAVNLIEFQRAYQAAAKLITVLDELTQTTLDMLRR